MAPDPLSEPLLEPSPDASWRQLSKQQLQLALPIIGMNVVQLLLVLMSAAFVGHIGALELASAQLAASLANVTGHYILQGTALGLETLGGQAVGAGQYRDLGYLTQFCFLVLTILAIMISLSWTLAERALIVLGQDKLLAAYAARYMQLLIPSLFANAWTQPLVKFLQSQGVTSPLMWASCVPLILHIPSNWFFIFHLNWGLDGAAIATDVAYVIMLLMLTSLVLWNRRAYERALPPLDFSAMFKGWGTFLKLGFFSATMMCLEFVSFDLIYLMGGLLPDPYTQVSALSVALNTAWLFATGYIGLGAATSTCVATELGRGSARGARKAALIGQSLALAFGLCTMTFSLIVHKQWPLLFVNKREHEVLALSSSLMVIASFMAITDAFQNNCGAILRGCGRQMVGTVVALISYYLVGVPASVIMGLVWKWGAWGLFGGFILATVSQTLILSVAVACTDWSKRVDLVEEERTRKRATAPASTLLG